MDNPEAKKTAGTGAPGPAGARAPAEGESSGAEFSPDDGASISDSDDTASKPPGIDASEQDVTFVDPSRRRLPAGHATSQSTRDAAS